MKSHFHIAVPLLTSLAIMAGTAAMADTVILFQGSVLVGKIKKENDATIVMKNYYGKFLIKRIKIDDVYKTNSYEEDIELHKKMRLPLNEDEIIKNYMAGEKEDEEKKTETAEETKPVTEEKKEIAKPEVKTEDDHWNGGRISFSGTFMSTFTARDGSHPTGLGGYLALDQGLDFMMGERHPMIPGIRLEGGYINYRNSTFRMSGYLASFGLMWAFPSMKNSWGCILLAFLPGASYLNTKISSSPIGWGGLTGRSINFTGQAILGYQRSFGVMSIFMQARYMYIMGQSWDHMSLGLECGIGFNAW